MPELRCEVITCLHNKQNYCELNEIEVTGSHAMVSAETSCGSFVERKGNEYQNSMKEATPKSDVKCHACECQYNEERKCHAGKIEVSGSSAEKSDETKCTTFKNK